MSEKKSAVYGSVLTPLVACNNLPPLDPGEPDSSVESLFNGLTEILAFEEFEIKDQTMAKSCIAGILLLRWVNVDEGITVANEEKLTSIP